MSSPFQDLARVTSLSESHSPHHNNLLTLTDTKTMRTMRIARMSTFSQCCIMRTSTCRPAPGVSSCLLMKSTKLLNSLATGVCPVLSRMFGDKIDYDQQKQQLQLATWCWAAVWAETRIPSGGGGLGASEGFLFSSSSSMGSRISSWTSS